ncbi:MAG: transglycosylase domain-containing protein [Chloroflexi bacterium]|nr:transglycosylase domain-containing protein [Chloroflexota bacterium]
MGLGLALAAAASQTALWLTAQLASLAPLGVAAGAVLPLPPDRPLDAGLPQTATILARDGSVLAELNDIRSGRRQAVPLSQIAPALWWATVATEDRRFFEHPGVDPLGLIRALGQNAGSGAVQSGASTLEMQIVRNLFLADERTEQTLNRKLKEALGALELDQRFSKLEILETYLNVVYYGHQAYGAEAAAQTYFGKSAHDLTVPEAALLAGLPQNPSAFDPLAHPEAAKARQEQVLDLMARAGLLTPEEAETAKAAPLEFASPEPPPFRAPHWVNYIRDVLRARFGPEALYTEGLRVQTTLDPEVQVLAEQVVAAGESVRRLARANNTALVVIDPRTSHVLAMVGSKDFWDAGIHGQVNLALAGRQPGSSIKPLVYLAGFERGLNPAVEVLDQPTAFSAPPGQPPYVPTNWENRYYGRVTLRDALGNSLNVPAVKVLKYIGVPAFQDMARRLGITTLDNWDPRWLSITLGGGEVRLLELVNAYATIVREGLHLPPEPLLRVETARGEVLYEAPAAPEGEQVVDPAVAYQLLHVMGDAGARQVTFGPRSPLNLSRPHMVKTGTTDDYRDTWTVGCLPQVCVGVWMGNTNNQPMVKVSSSLTAGKLWVDMIEALIQHYHYEPVGFPRPDGVVVKRIPNVGATRPGQADHEEVFLVGHENRFLLDMDWRRPD